MITAAEIKQKAQRQYMAFLRDYLQGKSFTPLELSRGKLPTDLETLRREGNALKNQSKAVLGFGYEVTWITRQTRSIGQQDFPERICIPTAEDYLHLIDKEREFALFRQDVAFIIEQLPVLQAWMQANPQLVIEHHGHWHDLIEVCHYFAAHPKPGIYVRELPIPVHTKFVEQRQTILRSLLESILASEAVNREAKDFETRFGLRRDEPQVRLRLLDGQWEKRFGLAVDDLTLPLSQLAALDFVDQHCIIAENLMNFLTIPKLPVALAIWGKGFQVTLLSQIGWLRNCRLSYWGDLDLQGFQILSALRSHFHNVQSVMMDYATFEQFQAFAVPGLAAKADLFPYLTSEEMEMAAFLSKNTLRLEQEHISQEYAVDKIKRIQAWQVRPA